MSAAAAKAAAAAAATTTHNHQELCHKVNFIHCILRNRHNVFITSIE